MNYIHDISGKQFCGFDDKPFLKVGKQKCGFTIKKRKYGTRGCKLNCVKACS